MSHNHEQLEKKLEKRGQKRNRKKTSKMRVSGHSVRDLQKLIKKKGSGKSLDKKAHS